MTKLFGQELSKRHIKGGQINVKQADKFHLYQLAVQSPEPDILFFKKTYSQIRHRSAQHLREDFSGTALLTANWINQGASFTAEAFDIDSEPLSWGLKHNLQPLGDAAKRATIHQADVRERSDKKPDIRCAQNFSYSVFTRRDKMRDYFKTCLEDLSEQGIFIIDIHGGQEATSFMEEETDLDYGFSYVWDQCEYWPVSGEAKMKIHFRFKDGSAMNNAFIYKWRVWSIPELTEILYETGFKQVDCYWEGTAADGINGNGIFKKSKKGSNDLSWVAYLVAIK